MGSAASAQRGGYRCRSSPFDNAAPAGNARAQTDTAAAAAPALSPARGGHHTAHHHRLGIEDALQQIDRLTQRRQDAGDPLVEKRSVHRQQIFRQRAIGVEAAKLIGRLQRNIALKASLIPAIAGRPFWRDHNMPDLTGVMGMAGIHMTIGKKYRRPDRCQYRDRQKS